MKKTKAHWIGLALGAVLAARAGAQAPIVPGTPPLAPPLPAAAAAAPAPGNIWSKLCMTPEQKAACKLRFCNSIIGKMVTGLLKPVSVFSGGLVADRCAAAQIAEDLKKPPDSAEGAAARIMADEAAAKERRAAARYLGTVDCHYWPEAEEGLINALRADRNECVRLEAAMSLGRGCCCTKKTIEALAITVSGDDRDGNPSEKSERVRSAAFFSLNNCLANQPPAPAGEVIPEKKKDEPVPPPKDARGGAKTDGVASAPSNAKGAVKGETAAKVTPAEYYLKIQMMPLSQIVENARQMVARNGNAVPGMRTGSKGVFNIVARAFGGPQSAPEAPAAETAPPAIARRGELAAPVAAPAQNVMPAHAYKLVPTPPMPQQKVEERKSNVQLPPPPVKRDAVTLPQVKPATPDLGPQVKFETAPQRLATGPKVEFTTTKAEAPKSAGTFSTQRPADQGVQTAAHAQPQWRPAPQAVKNAVHTQPQTPAANQGQVVRVVWHDETPAAPVQPAARPKAPQSPPAEIQKLVTALQSSRTAEERARAAEDLGSSVYSSHPEVFQALTTAGRTDQSAVVRTTCQRYLARINTARPQ